MAIAMAEVPKIRDRLLFNLNYILLIFARPRSSFDMKKKKGGLGGVRRAQSYICSGRRNLI
jgi:hypothetical protein